MAYWFLIVGAVVGCVLTVLTAMWCRFAGLLRVHPNEEGERPYLFLELNDDGLGKIIGKKYVVFRVREDARK